MASIMDILKIQPFVEVSVGQLLWGYEDPLLKLAKDVVPKEQKLPYEEFGLMYGVSISRGKISYCRDSHGVSQARDPDPRKVWVRSKLFKSGCVLGELL